MNKFSGNYPIQHRVGEIERLKIQSDAMAPETVAMLERFGSMKGWVCLDVGCGPGGITDLLSTRVGPGGRVIGLDMNGQFLDHARKNAPSNVEFRLGDAYQSDLPAGVFDLVHVRFVASTAGNPEQLLKEARRLARRGGIIALQEPDGSTLACFPPHPAWDRLKAAYMAAFKGVGSDLTLARKLYFVVHGAGLHNVQYRTAILSVRSIDPMVDYLPSMIEFVARDDFTLDLLNEDDLVTALAECRQHLANPGTAFTMWTLAQVWGWTA